MTTFLQNQLTQLKASVSRYELGDQPETDPVLKLPDVIIAKYPTTYDSTKKTILVYGHYDVQPEGEGWTRDPWTLEEKDGKLYGRGSTDDKGPVLAWLNALEAYQRANVDVPVNLIFCFEGMEESGSIGFASFVRTNRDIFNNVDAACISDNYWLTTKRPCLTYGLRGINYFTINISQKPLPGHTPVPLHSGMFGGTVCEPMSELVILLSKLVDSTGKILIPGINELVDDLSSSEMTEYENIDFTMKDFNEIIGSEAAIYDDPTQILMHRWRYPSLTIHGISGADSTTNQTTAIYPSVTGKFSIRTVPSMDGETVSKLVIAYVEKEFNKLQSKNVCSVQQFGESAPYWLGTRDDANFQAGKAATNRVYGTFPDLTREGGRLVNLLPLTSLYLPTVKSKQSS